MAAAVPALRPRTAHAGFTLLSVLVSMFIMAVGILGIVRAVATVTGAATQNETLTSISALTNGFWGVVQADPAMVVSPSFSGTFTTSNVTSAPTPLQTWLAQATAATTLPNAQVTIATAPDAASGAACSVANGCTVILTLSWRQVASAGIAAATRTQTFYYQFGL